jgi:hypothetical protein
MGKSMDKYMAGINLGSWLEMYEHNNDPWMLEHFDANAQTVLIPELITESDVAQIASWGFDHIRVPFSYEVIIAGERPHEFSAGIKILDDTLIWCKKYNLNLILDMHKAPGYSFSNVNVGRENPFLTDERYQKQFFEIWKMLAKRYMNERENLAFELLNEVVEGPAERWNRIADGAVHAIREVDPERIILFGGIYYNSVYHMHELAVYDDDPNIIYNFHFYEPILFTHQLAWPPASAAFNRAIEYPGPVEGFDVFLDAHPEFEETIGRYRGRDYCKATMLMDFEPVFAFMKEHPNAQVYCGEFGVISFASVAGKRAWLKDITDIFRESGIGRAVWDYTDGEGGWFAFTDLKTRKPLDMECIRIAAKK